VGVSPKGCTDLGCARLPSGSRGGLPSLAADDDRTKAKRICPNATQLAARNSDDGDRPSADSKAPSLLDMACFGSAGDSACPCRDRREYGLKEKLDLDSRVSILLNRVPKKPLLTKNQVEEILELPVTKVFSDDYHGVSRALTNATVVTLAAELGRELAHFADRSLKRKPPVPQRQVRVSKQQVERQRTARPRR
jgi:hypothetical protein